MIGNEIVNLFHKLWGQCADGIYQKSHWVKMQYMLGCGETPKVVECTPTTSFPECPIVFEDQHHECVPQPTFQNPPSIYERPIQEHGGGKYLRKIMSADGQGEPIAIDVYCVIEAFGITCPALQHALKKILACGQRGKGGRIADIHGTFDALWRALELEKQRQANAPPKGD